MSFFDFDRLNRPETGRRPINPIEIFRTRPTLDDSQNDLWQGQSKALEAWHTNRTTNDALISLHTGAGKSVVGLLICQSLVNEGLSRVLYVCATNDLVTQTSREATKKLALEHTVRARGEWSNNYYEIGRAFCITNYQAVFNSRTVFSKDRKPQAIVFDDAHVAEKAIRDCYTLTITSKKYPEVFQRICSLLKPHFVAVSREDYFSNVLSGASVFKVVQAPPSAVVSLERELADLFQQSGLNSKETFVMGHLADQLARCSMFVSQSSIEICPTFLPSRRIPVLADPQIRRIYLSATLTSEVDFCRAFGRRPTFRIEPESDAGTGER